MKQSCWDAKTYSRFLAARTRPAQDLLSVVPTDFQPKVITDLGCGPGNSTILLRERWPQATVTGIDSSADMLQQARASYPDICFEKGDIAQFSPTVKSDLIFANASLQWVDDHEMVIPQLIDKLNVGGMLAIQMPNNFHSPSHQTTLDVLSYHPDWKPLLKNLRYGPLSEPFYRIVTYYELLIQSGLSQLQLWETEYFQEMADHHAIFDWAKGTGLRPVLAALDADNQDLFRKAYIEQISTSYPLQSNGKLLFPFRRLFMLGLRTV